jgi:hypothetical protein
MATTEGFEPSRAKPNGLAGHRLNHSAKSSTVVSQKGLSGWTRTTDLGIAAVLHLQSPALPTELPRGLAGKLVVKKWRIRVSIPVPRRCERRTLPIELIPQGW